MAETRCGQLRLREFDVHEVPSPCRLVAELGRVAIAIAILVRPYRLAADVMLGQGVGIGRGQCRNLGAD